jgi:hypothetical protein
MLIRFMIKKKKKKKPASASLTKNQTKPSIKQHIFHWGKYTSISPRLSEYNIHDVHVITWWTQVFINYIKKNAAL